MTGFNTKLSNYKIVNDIIINIRYTDVIYTHYYTVDNFT